MYDLSERLHDRSSHERMSGAIERTKLPFTLALTDNTLQTKADRAA
jgi:hypothetical protein